MQPRLRRVAAGALAAAFFAIPLFPAFITLTGATIPGVSLVPPAATIALACAALALGCVFVLLLAVAPRRALPTVVPFAALPAAAAVAAAVGLDPRAGLLFVGIGAAGVLWHAAIVRFFNEPGVATASFAALLVSGALAAGVAIVTALTRWPIALSVIGHGRAIGTFVLPGELAGYALIAIPLAFALARTARERWMRALAWIAFALESVAFVLTFSRAGWVGMAAAVATFILLLRRRNGPRYAIAAAGVGVVVVAAAFNAHHDPSENFTRLSIWRAALETVLRFPLTGVGPFDFARFYPLVRAPGGEPVALHAHSIVLTVAAEAGLAGVGALAFGWLRFAGELRGRLRAGAGGDRVAIAIAAGLVGTWVQGTIDTVTVVIFGLWMPMTALAIACAERAAPAPAAARPAAPPRARAIGFGLVAAAAVGAALLQSASAAMFARGATSDALPARMPHAYGIRVYRAIARIVPVPFVIRDLAVDAIANGDLAAARAEALRLPRGATRSDLLGRVALAGGHADDAVDALLEAGDDELLQDLVAALQQAGKLRGAFVLEERIRDRLAADETRPNALSDSWWRLGRLAVRLSDLRSAARDYDRAIALSPFNTKYLIDAGMLARERGDGAGAGAYFSRAVAIDPRRAHELPPPQSAQGMIR